jgi:tRNA (guanine6-N2)-methyltransferase
MTHGSIVNAGQDGLNDIRETTVRSAATVLAWRSSGCVDGRWRVEGSPTASDAGRQTTAPGRHAGEGRMQWLVRTVRGLEGLVAEEIRERALGTVERIGHREVLVAGVEAARAMMSLRTADDVLLVVAAVDGIGHTRADLPRLAHALSDVDTWLGRRCTGVDVSASFLGHRNYNRFDIEDTVGSALARLLGMPYHSRRLGARPPAGTCSFRVTLADDRATIGLRVADRPLHRRAYKAATLAGTLHPPVAAAMARLAGVRPGEVVLDPCCGAGTLLIESHQPGSRLLGVDIDPRALAAATGNGAGLPIEWLRADAGRLPLDTGAIDRVVVNPPWGRQAPARATLATYPERLWREIERVLRPGGRFVGLLHRQDAEAEVVIPIRLAGRPAVIVAGYAGQLVPSAGTSRSTR